MTKEEYLERRIDILSAAIDYLGEVLVHRFPELTNYLVEGGKEWTNLEDKLNKEYEDELGR